MSHSQYEEFQIVEDFFGEHAGRFLDIGAGDGLTLSNTHGLAGLGWEGVLVEPNPIQFARLFELYRDKPHLQLLLCGVGAKASFRELHFGGDHLSTFYEDTLQLSHMAPYFGRALWVHVISADHLAHFGPFDFVTIDAEGMDSEIIESGDALLSQTSLLCYEHDLPGRRSDEPENIANRRRISKALARMGFTRTVAVTQGNTFVARPGRAPL